MPLRRQCLIQMRTLAVTSWTLAYLLFAALFKQTAGRGYPGLPVLDEPKICTEFTFVNGSGVSRRYYDSDCYVVTTQNSSRTAVHDINLVVLTAGSGGAGDIMTRTEPYVAMAMQEIEDSDLLPGYRLNAYLADSRCSAPDATANAIRAMTTGPPKHGVVGDACSAGCVAVNDVVQFFNVLQMSHSCSSPELSDHLLHPFFTRVAPSYTESVSATYALMKLLDWHRVGVIYDFRDLSTLGKDVVLELFAKSKDELDSYQWTVLMAQKVTNAEDADAAVATARLVDGRVLVNIMYEDVGVQVMCAAHKQGMLPPHWTQVSPSGWWQGFLDIYNTRVDCTTEEMFAASYGWLSASPLGGFLASDGLHDLSGQPIRAIHSRYLEECVEFFDSSLGCSDGGPPYIYDALWLYATILHDYLINEGHTYEDLNTLASRARLFNLSLMADFVGITGRVRHFNDIDPKTTAYRGSIGDREGPQKIRQVRGESTAGIWFMVGHHFPDHSFTWYSDLTWSREDPSKRLPCAGAECIPADGWVPSDRNPLDCPADKVWTLATGCAPCPAGQHANGTVCMPCPAGTANNMSGQLSCPECPPGLFNNVLGAEFCSQCATGRFSSTPGASACVPCGQGGFQSDIGSTACVRCGGVLVTRLRGAVDPEECVCPAGSYRPFAASKADPEDDASPHLLYECRDCTEGIECPVGTDMNNYETLPIVRAGYFADSHLSVFKCRDDGRRCRRGRVGGNCAEGRIGRSCAFCLHDKAPASDGSCKDCNPWESSVLVVVVLILGCTFLVLVYRFFDRSSASKQSHKLLLVAMTLSMMVTMLQQIVSLATVSIAWPGPMRALFEVLNMLVFDMEAMKINCMLRPRPLFSFAARMLMFTGCLLFLVSLHVLVVFFKHQGRFKERHPVLINGFGTICLIFYVTIFISILVPLQCARNPNRLWTLKPYPSVICWDGEEEHTWMLIIGVFATLVPLGFLVRCCYVIRIIPHNVRYGRVRFLRSYAFLFFRYRPDTYWFSLCHLIRSLLVALTTVMPVASLQILLMQIVLLVHLSLVCTIQPWRVQKANALEGFLTVGVLLMLCCAALIIAENDEDEAMAWTFIALVVLSVVVACGVAIYMGCQALRDRLRKPFHFFICHHKLATGCMARFLNVECTARGKKTFIDTDDLRELDQLFDYVSSQTQSLVLICSKYVLLRPWCVGELVTAFNGRIDIAKILRPDFADPDDEFVADYAALLGDDLSLLTRYGMDVTVIQKTLRYISELGGFRLPSKLSPGTMHSLCTMLGEKHLADEKVAYISQSDTSFAAVVLIADIESMEVACTSFLLASMLTTHTQVDILKAPVVMTEEVDFPASADICILMCTAGCLAVEQVLQRMAKAFNDDIPGMPVVADESFQFPDSEFIHTHGTVLKSVSDDPEAFGNYILCLFISIASMFQPGSYGSTLIVLTAKAKDIALRIGQRQGLVKDSSPNRQVSWLVARPSDVTTLAQSRTSSTDVFDC